MNLNYAIEFEELIAQLFELMGYELISSNNNHIFKDSGIDLAFSKGKNKLYIEVKFYRSTLIPASTVRDSSNRLAYLIKKKGNGSGILIVNNILGKYIKEYVLAQYGIQIWDRKILYDCFSKYSIKLRDRFERLLLETQQGTNTNYVFNGFEKKKSEHIEVKNLSDKINYKEIPKNQGKKLYQQLNKIPCGKKGWNKYEKKCKNILEFLFENDLSLWDKQSRTEDGLSRFDLICRIASGDDYWKALINSFNTRFVLFEFKNHCNQITQGQIYTTERYLFNKALRSVGFIISRKGGNDNAIKAAKGALKEHGKLILLISDDDLRNMLELKDNGESPNDYLSSILDKWLISLSR